MPSMPPKGIDGIQYMSMQTMPKNFPQTPDPHNLVIMAARRSKNMQTNLYSPGPEDSRFWNGSTWVREKNEAKMYSEIQEAHSDGEKVKIWNIVPNEWKEGCP
jgi:hypothetical protein